METTENNKPNCAIKCLRNAEDVSHSVHALKYGVNIIGRGLNNDIVLKNLNVSRAHCHLRVEKNGFEDIAYIKDLGTSNGTIVGNVNLVEFEEHQLNDLDMIVLACVDEGVVLQFINKIDSITNFSNFSNMQTSNKRKGICLETLDEPTATKLPKFLSNALPSMSKEPFSNKNLNPSNETKNSSNNLQQLDLNHSSSSPVILNTVNDSNFSTTLVEKPKIVLPNNSKASCSNHKDNVTSVQIKTEPDTMNIFSQGTYRNEEDSVIVIYSSDEENCMNENGLEIPIIKIEQEENIHLSTMSTRNTNLSMSKNEQNSSTPVWSMHCQVNDIVSDDEDDIIYIPPQSNLISINNDNDNDLMSSSDGDGEYNSKCAKIINPLPMMSNLNNNKKKQTKLLTENKNILKTRAKSEKKINNKKKTEEFTIEQNKNIIQERRLKLQELAKNKSSSSTEKITLNENPSIMDNYIDTPSTTARLKKKTRISRFQQNSNLSSIPTTSKSQLATNVKENENIKTNNKTELNPHGHLDSQILEHSSRKSFISVNHTYFETLSKICKWNAVWLREERFVEQSPPLVKSVYKMKGTFENTNEYSSIVIPLLLYEIWSKISDSYNMIIYKNPSLEKCIFEKSLKKDIPLLTCDVISVDKKFSSSFRELKSLNVPLWCLKCIEKNKNNIESLTGPKFSLKGYLCIAIIQSKNFETDAVKVKKPTKSKNIFFAYVNTSRKIGVQSSTQLYIELIVTQKTENIPVGTPIVLMDIFYLHSELRLFQALSNMTTSSLNKALITPQYHNYNIDYSKVYLNYYNINNLMLNDSQKDAVKMAVSICISMEPNVGLIIGPPGTGKTNVICNIVLTLMSEQPTNTDSKPKLLICAPSNEAVDVLVRRIIDIKKDLKNELQFSVVRVGNGQKYDPHSPINDVLLDNLVNDKMNNPKSGLSKALPVFSSKRDLEKDILLNADVIVTTLNSCFSYRMENTFISSTDNTRNIQTTSHFTACIVDEAGQCVEPLNCVPLLLGIKKLILVGDDKQLQPVIKSKTAKDNGFGISLFKRLKTWYEHKRFTRKFFPITMLDTQYRMHHEISSFPSEYFYNGKVKTSPSIEKRKELPFHPYIILEHENKQDHSGEINIGEAYMIVNLVELLMNSECKSLIIAILTPYHKQREQINLLLKNKKITLNVNTIDSFQGGECDILLISTVRTNGVGFMDDMCRLNVALTRARQSLIICGNFISLKGERVWYDLLENAKKRKLIKKVSNNVISSTRTLFALIKY